MAKKQRPEVIETKEDSSQVTAEPARPGLVAKKDFKLFHPHDKGTYRRDIKAGDDISDVPEHYHPNLRAEGVL